MTNVSVIPAAAVLLSAILCGHSAAAAEAAKDWQIKSLKGITSIQYAVAEDPHGQLTKALKAGVTGLNVAAKQVNFPAPITLDTTDALVKVAVDKRKNGKNWVGLYVHQKSKLDRDPSISYEAETYGIGALVPNAKVNATVEELVSQFGSDFKSANASQ